MSSTHPLAADPRMREVTVPVATVWRSPDAPRDLDEPALRDVPDVATWADAMDGDDRAGLHGRAETQLLLGEGALVLEERDGWSRVEAVHQRSRLGEHGYPGWVRSAHLGTPVPQTEGRTVVVTDPTATATLDDGRPLPVSLGTALWVDHVGDGTVTGKLPDGRLARLRLSSVRLSDKREQPAFDGGLLVDTARHFLGRRYLWGGTSAWGLDCSGLVHLVLRSRGVLLPRDAADQAEHVEPVALEAVRPGDLYFFARPGERVYHVGFVSRPVEADGTRWMLHAPEGGGLIEDAPLAPHRVETLVSAGRVTHD